MEKKKIDNLLNGAGNVAKGLFEKTKGIAVNVVDQNDDGKLDLEDVEAIAESVGDSVKKGTEVLKQTLEDNKRALDLKTLQPIFPETLDQADFFMSKLIRITERSKKYFDSEVCKGSVGFICDKGGLRVVNLFQDSLDIFGLTFYPDEYCEFYYVNPTDRDNYISLAGYFEYLKTVRINELQRVAQSLGARHFKVTYKEEKISFHENKQNAKFSISKKESIDASAYKSEEKYSNYKIEAELNMDPHEPQEPELVYLLKDDSVQNLIKMRMTGGNSFHSHKIAIKMSNTSGIKENDAVKIDAALKGMKVSGNATITAEAKNESRRLLEYEIDF